MTDFLFVDEIEVGDRFVWCDRSVVVERIEIGKTYYRSRRSRYLTVAFEDSRLRLHYFDVERVKVGP